VKFGKGIYFIVRSYRVIDDGTEDTAMDNVNLMAELH